MNNMHDTIDRLLLDMLRVGMFDAALQAEAQNMRARPLTAELGEDGVWIVAAGKSGILYEACEDEREARILALWHSLDETVTFEDIVIRAMDKHYVNGVRVDPPTAE